ncbi:MAG: alpha/beta hydrolase [Clostridiales bacterium]|nr:alpha/beta hydrolase [Clostridiales bacterium]
MYTINPDYLLSEEDFASGMSEAVLPYLAKRETRLTVSARDGAQINVHRYDADAPKGTCVVLHGFTEAANKFSEIIYSLLNNGFSVLAYDQRGHGESHRDPAVSDMSLTHVRRFADYVDDLDAVVNKCLKIMLAPYCVFAHSMGGAVACLYAEKRPEVFRALALCAPMIAPRTGGLPVWTLRFMGAAACMIGKSRRRIFISKPYSGHENFETSCCTSRARFDWWDDRKYTCPRFSNNGPTYSWMREAMGVTGKLLKNGMPEKIACPVGIWQAENDWEVKPLPQEQFISRVKHGKLVKVAGARHEIYRSADETLYPWWHEVLGFLNGALARNG